jgi:hypothetical protein
MRQVGGTVAAIVIAVLLAGIAQLQPAAAQMYPGAAQTPPRAAPAKPKYYRTRAYDGLWSVSIFT